MRTRVLFCPCDGWLLSLLLSPCCCKEADFTLRPWLIRALRHAQCPPTIYITGTPYSTDKTPHTPQCVGVGGSRSLSVLAIVSGVSSSPYINAHCWKLSTQALCDVNPRAASAGLEETAVIEIYHVSVLSFLFTWTHVGFHECFLADSHPQAARLCVPSQGFPGELVLCMGWMSVPQAAACTCQAAWSWDWMPCSPVQGSFRKCQIYCGEVGIEQGLSSKAWRKKLVKQNSSRSPSETEDGNWVAESTQGEDPRAFTATRMLTRILYNEKSQPCSELQGCHSTLEDLMTTETTWALLPWFDNHICLDAVIILLYVSAAWHFFFLPPYVLNIEVEVSTSIKTHKENKHNLSGLVAQWPSKFAKTFTMWL